MLSPANAPPLKKEAVLLRGTGLRVPVHRASKHVWLNPSVNIVARPRLRLHTPPVCFAASTSPSRPAKPLPGLFPMSVDDTAPRPLPTSIEGQADDPTLHNPLERFNRLGTNWMGVIFELEGVAVEYEYGDVGQRSWLQLADEEGKSAPPQWALRKAEGMKNEQVIQEVFCWSRNPVEVRRLCTRKEAILVELLGDRKPLVHAGTLQLLETLKRTGSPVALVASAPERRVLQILQESGLSNKFEVVVTADDVYRGKPDPEGYLYAAQRIGRPPIRCVVVGSSNLSVEAAHEVGMACVAVAGRHPIYELTAADLVVRTLTDVSFMNLKQLFSLEESVASNKDEEGVEMEEEDEFSSSSRTTTTVMDYDMDYPPY